MLAKDKGLYNLLLASCQAPCSVPYSSGIFTFPDPSGDYVMFTIKDGMGRKGMSSQAYRALSPFNCWTQYHMLNGRATTRIENAELKRNMKAISDHLVAQAKTLFKAETVRVDLTFGLENESKIVLLGNSRLTYSTTRPKTSPAESEPSNTPKLGNDNPQPEEGRTSQRSTERSVTPMIQADVAKAIRVELSRPIPMKRCITQSSKCGPTKCTILRSKAVFHRVKCQFPNVDGELLRDMIAKEMRRPDENVNVCASCYSALTQSWSGATSSPRSKAPDSHDEEAPPHEEDEKESQNEETKDDDENEPATNNSEQFTTTPKRRASPPRTAMERRPLPWNIRMSPYKDKVPMQVPEPAKPDTQSRARTRPATVMSRQRSPGDERLSSLSPQAMPKKFRVSKGIKPRKGLTYSLPEFQCPVPLSVLWAKECYSPVPFDITKLDPRRKKHLLQ